MTNNRIVAINESYFDVIDTPDKAYWLGFIATDGSVDNDCLSIRLKDGDAEHIKLCRQSLGSEHEIGYGVNGVGSHWARIRFHSRKMMVALSRHGIESNKVWSVRPWNGTDALMPHYWRGAVDGDGWISISANGRTKRFWTVGLCGNQYMVEGFTEFVNSALGFSTKPTTRKVKNSEKHGHEFYQTAYTGTYRAASICRLLEYDDMSAIALERKRQAAAQIMEYVPLQKAPRFDISVDIAGAILAEYCNGATVKQLSKKYNVGKGTIYNIAHRLGHFADMDLPAITR